MPLGVVAEDFTVDQTGLSIAETVNSAGLPRLNFEYTSPTPITFSGERNFLALAFDLRVPLGANATVTYSPTLLADATLASSGSSCTDATGAALECSSSHPSLSLRLNPEVPGPLAVGALPAMLHASRRLRRRVRGAAG
jgi:hypothetical protein